MKDTILLTKEQLSKIISTAIYGFVNGVMGQDMPLSIKDLHQTTLDSIVNEDLHEEFIHTYGIIEGIQENPQSEEDE